MAVANRAPAFTAVFGACLLLGLCGLASAFKAGDSLLVNFQSSPNDGTTLKASLIVRPITPGFRAPILTECVGLVHTTHLPATLSAAPSRRSPPRGTRLQAVDPLCTSFDAVFLPSIKVVSSQPHEASVCHTQGYSPTGVRRGSVNLLKTAAKRQSLFEIGAVRSNAQSLAPDAEHTRRPQSMQQRGRFRQLQHTRGLACPLLAHTSLQRQTPLTIPSSHPHAR